MKKAKQKQTTLEAKSNGKTLPELEPKPNRKRKEIETWDLEPTWGPENYKKSMK